MGYGGFLSVKKKEWIQNSSEIFSMFSHNPNGPVDIKLPFNNVVLNAVYLFLHAFNQLKRNLAIN